MSQFQYQGRKVEIKRENETGSGFYYAVIDDNYKSSLQSTENIAAFYAMKHIDGDDDLGPDIEENDDGGPDIGTDPQPRVIIDLRAPGALEAFAQQFNRHAQ